MQGLQPVPPFLLEPLRHLQAIVISPGPIGEPIYNATGLSEGVASPPFQDSPAAFFYTDFDRVSMVSTPDS